MQEQGQYVIEGQTLNDIADAIREQEQSSEPIQVGDYADRILGIDLTTEEYMRISDLLEYPKATSENDYTQGDINKVDELINHFAQLGDDTNGE